MENSPDERQALPLIVKRLWSGVVARPVTWTLFVSKYEKTLGNAADT